MTKVNMSSDEMLEDLLVSQMQMLRLRLMQNIADIDKYTEEIERRFNDRRNKKRRT